MWPVVNREEAATRTVTAGVPKPSWWCAAVERAAGDADPLLAEAAIDLGQPQPFGQPRRDLLAVRVSRSGISAGPPEAGPCPATSAAATCSSVGPAAPRCRRALRAAATYLATVFRSLPVPRAIAWTLSPQAEPAQHLAYFNHTQLPVDHDHLRDRGRRGPAWPPGSGWGKGSEKPPGGKLFENQPVTWGKGFEKSQLRRRWASGLPDGTESGKNLAQRRPPPELRVAVRISKEQER